MKEERSGRLMKKRRGQLAKKVVSCSAVIGMGIAVLTAPYSEAMLNGKPAGDADSQAQQTVALHGCTGAAIAPGWVVTALHCFPQGKNGTQVEDTSVAIFTGIHTANRKQYAGDSVYFSPSGDVALVRMKECLDLPSYATVADKPAADLRGTMGQAYGWGAGTGSTLSTADSQVKGVYQLPGSYNNGQMFTSVHQNGAYPRPGDSGGPLFVNGQVQGVLSAIGAADNPTGNYTDLHALSGWINSTMTAKKPQCMSDPESSTEVPTSTSSSAETTSPDLTTAETTSSVTTEATSPERTSEKTTSESSTEVPTSETRVESTTTTAKTPAPVQESTTNSQTKGSTQPKENQQVVEKAPIAESKAQKDVIAQQVKKHSVPLQGKEEPRVETGTITSTVQTTVSVPKSQPKEQSTVRRGEEKQQYPRIATGGHLEG